MDLVVPDKQKTIREGAIAPWNTPAYSHEHDRAGGVGQRLRPADGCAVSPS